ncbi:MAG: glycerophosphodiester phosphodiesterase [Anaerolineae bacterium]
MIEQAIAGSGKVAIVGHRGAMGYAPENTLASFAKAAELGAHAFECDVHLTGDGEAVVIHDATVERVSNGHGVVAEMTLAELRQLDVGSWFQAAEQMPPSSEYACQRIPTLAEALDISLRLGLDIVVELKGEPEPPRRLIERVVYLIAEREMQDRVAVISFNHPSLSLVRQLDNRISTGILFGHGIPDPVAEAKLFGASSIRPHYSRITRRLAEEAHEAGMCLHAWTVNDGDLAERLIGLGVDSIGTNYPDRIRRLLVQSNRLA